MITQLIYLFVLSLGISCASTIPSRQNLEPVCALPDQLSESSGMVSLGNDLFVGNNDSGNPAELYVFSLNRKTATKSVKVLGGFNDDWEELTDDQEYVYIANTGNNSGTRKNLAIFRVNKDDLLHKDEAMAEKISFYYPEQKKFDNSDNHNFDCEAMVCIGDSLYLFTKNRGNLKTDLYSLPKVPGHYAARHLNQFDVAGLITGADFRDSGDTEELVLLGYTGKDLGFHPFLLYFSAVQGTDFFKSPVRRFNFNGKLQTETVVFYDDESVYITNEEEHGDKGLIYKVDIKN